MPSFGKRRGKIPEKIGAAQLLTFCVEAFEGCLHHLEAFAQRRRVTAHQSAAVMLCDRAPYFQPTLVQDLVEDFEIAARILPMVPKQRNHAP